MDYLGESKEASLAIAVWEDVIWHRTEEALSCRTWWALVRNCALLTLCVMRDHHRIF